jgi:dTDP-4-dehydrorhamnose 3,5-epimerase
MKFSETSLSGSFIIDLEIKGDARGWFARTFCKKEFSAIGHEKDWVQMNHSFSSEKGTVRGMHFQQHPFSEIKMVRCIAGAVFDVIVDIRKDSPTFLKWIGVELSAVNKKMIYIPEGFAHGFQTLTTDCELIYHHSAFYEPAAERGLNVLDPEIKIEWPVEIKVLSDRDKSHPFINNQFKGI